jgi:AAA15 family ATPase/GTPase
MTRIERVEIEGFKGIRSLEFEPSGLNLITGRNNTGKTSVLEAIELVFSPRNIDRFDSNIEDIISKKSEYSKIATSEAEKNTRLELRRASRDEVLNYIVKNSQFLVEDGEETFQEYDLKPENLQKQVEKSVEAVMNNLSKREINELKRECVVLLHSTGSYPYFEPDGVADTIIERIHETLMNEILDNERKQASLGMFGVNRRLKNISKNPNQNGFLISAPETERSVNFIECPSDKNIKSLEDDTAIKIDDINDFLKERELVDDLKAFDTDYLVFKNEEDGKWQVPYEFMGDGFKTMVGILWELLDDEENDVVLIEEPENHLHPGYVQELIYFLIELAREDGVQLFITTHDADFIGDFFTDAMRPEDREFLEDEFSVLRLEENAAQQLDYEEAEHELKDLHLDLRGI